MKFSLITVCYNSADMVRSAIESVLGQTCQGIEYIVVDGGSIDGTVQIAKEYISKFEAKSYKMKVLSEQDEGMYDAINKGIHMATGDVIGILNADDVLHDEQVIERVADVFLGEKIDVVYGDVRFVKNCLITRSEYTCFSLPYCLIKEGIKAEASNNELTNYRINELASLRNAKTLRYYSARRWKPWMLQWGYMPPHPGVYIRRECFARLGYYKTDYHIAADYELLIRFLRKGGLTMRYLDACIVAMRPGGKSTKNWRSNLLLNQEIVRGNRENGYFCCLPMLVPKYIFKIFEFIIPLFKN
jgi:glycosyltransferase involved in cell wall biosynthesis